MHFRTTILGYVIHHTQMSVIECTHSKFTYPSIKFQRTCSFMEQSPSPQAPTTVSCMRALSPHTPVPVGEDCSVHQVKRGWHVPWRVSGFPTY